MEKQEKLEKKLTLLFDFHRFWHNPELDAIIQSVESRYFPAEPATDSRSFRSVGTEPPADKPVASDGRTDADASGRVRQSPRFLPKPIARVKLAQNSRLPGQALSDEALNLVSAAGTTERTPRKNLEAAPNSTDCEAPFPL